MSEASDPVALVDVVVHAVLISVGFKWICTEYEGARGECGT